MYYTTDIVKDLGIYDIFTLNYIDVTDRRDHENFFPLAWMRRSL